MSVKKNRSKTDASKQPRTESTKTRKTKPSVSEAIDDRTSPAEDWRAACLTGIRTFIMQTDSGIIEEVKWRKPSNAMRGVPVWSHPDCGIICTGETYKDKVKLTFARGAVLGDPTAQFNASLEGSTRRAIDIHEGEMVNEKAFQSLIRAAIQSKASAG